MEQNIYDILFHIFPALIVISIGKFYIKQKCVTQICLI